MNYDPVTSGLARVQSESHIPASTWRQWCDRLDIDPALAVELWDDVCHPMMLASGKAPDLALILQLRAARPEIYIDDFRDELPAVLLSTTLCDGLHEEGRGVVRGALLRLYRFLGVKTGEPVGQSFCVHAGNLALLEGVLPDDLTLPKLVKVLCAEKGSLEDLCRLGRRGLGEDDRGIAVAAALDAGLELLHPQPPPPPSETDADEVDDEDEVDDDEVEDDEVDDDEVDDDEAEDDEDDDDGDTPQAAEPGPQELYIRTLRDALTIVYADESIADPKERDARMQTIEGFNPLGSRIPTMEEAKRMSERVVIGGEGRQRALQGRGGGGGAPRATSAGGGRASVRPPSASGGGSTASVIRPTSASAKASPAGGAKPASDAAAESEAPSSDEPAPPAPDADGKLPVPMISRNELDEAVDKVATGINKVRELDERLYLLFCEPEHDLDSPQTLAEDLVTADSSAEQAGVALRLAAQQQRVRSILDLPPDRRLKDRRFDLEAEAWLNTIANYRRSFDTDSRQLISLPRVLDFAAGALVRIEALRAAVEIVRYAESAEEATVVAVSQCYETLLSDVTFLADSEVIAAARQRADTDAETVLAAVAADAWIDKVRAAAFDWVDTVTESGAIESLDALTAFLDETPLALDSPGEGEFPGAFPDELAADTALGEIVDATRTHVVRAAWKALLVEHHPRKTVDKLDSDLRRRLRGHARITPRRERHQRNPRVALPVASLERLSGNPELSHYFVRLSTDGKLLFLEDYEDGSYIDLYELQESTKRQMHARARERARDGATGELQTGSSYLLTVGRTKNPFASSEQDVLAACVVDDEGERVTFDPS